MHRKLAGPVRAFALATPVVLAVACNDPIVGLAEVAGVYDVMELDSERLPVLVELDPVRSGERWLASSQMTFHPDGRLIWSSEYEYVSPTGRDRWVEEGQHYFRVVRGDVRLHFHQLECCYALAERSGDRLAFTMNGRRWVLGKR